MNSVMDDASFKSDSPSRMVRSLFGPAPVQAMPHGNAGDWYRGDQLRCNSCKYSCTADYATYKIGFCVLQT